MTDETTPGGMEESREDQRRPGPSEIDTLIERSLLSTPAAKSLRERTSPEVVQPILGRANSLASSPFAIGIEILPRELSGVITDHPGTRQSRSCGLK